MISVAINHLTEKLINQSGRFTVVIAGEEQKRLALQLGSLKGEGADKFEHFSVKTITTETGEALIPDGAAAWMACAIESSQEIKGYRLFIGRVVSQNDTGKPPLVWHKDAFFSLKPV
jgi:flavin reductase (DIM6/NTAB) family NADH-FMN oxidoreductase RutF